MGFTERQIGHMTLNKYSRLWKCYEQHHDFETMKGLYKPLKSYEKEENGEKTFISSDEWIPD